MTSKKVLRINQKKHSMYTVIYYPTLSLGNAIFLRLAIFFFSCVFSYFIKLEVALLYLFANTVKNSLCITYDVFMEFFRVLFVPLRWVIFAQKS